MAKQRLSEIDGLRGIAALSVMLGHWGEATKKQAPPPEWGHALQTIFLDDFSFGRLGIVAFFCISGFVVPFSFRGTHPMIAFPVSRMFRLYPAYWASIALAIVVFPLIGAMHLTVPQILANMTMIQLALAQPSVLGVYWTLFIELIFYTICFVLFGAKQLHNARANFIMMCLFLLLAVGWGAYRFVHTESGLPVGVPTYLAAMHFGTIARLRTLENARMSAKLYPIALCMLVAGVMSANTLAYLHAQNELVGWIASDVAYLVGLSLFLLCIHRRWFSGTVLAYLGLISYSMYLFHMIVILTFAAIWPLIPRWEVAVAIYTPIYFAVTIAIATLVHRFIEKPAVNAGRWLDRQIDATIARFGRKPVQTS